MTQVWYFVSPNNQLQSATPQWRLAQVFATRAEAEAYVAAQATRPWPYSQRQYQVR